MPIVIDPLANLVRITSPTTAVDAQELHDAIEDYMASPEGMLYGDVIQPEGKIEDPVNPGIFSQIIIILNSPWQIQFYGGSGYTRIYGGKLVGGLSDQPIKATGTAGDITVLESPVDGLTVVSGSGITEQDKDDIVDKVWQEPLSGHAVVSGGAAEAMVSTHAFAVGAAMLESSAALMIYDTVASGFVETVTKFKGGGTASLSAEDDNYTKRLVMFTTGTIAKQVAEITAYDAVTNIFTVTELTSPPSDGDGFMII